MNGREGKKGKGEEGPTSKERDGKGGKREDRGREQREKKLRGGACPNNKICYVVKQTYFYLKLH